MVNILFEEVDGSYYLDIVFQDKEIDKIQNNEIVEGQTFIKKKRLYVGIRKHGQWDNDEEEI